jgi:hypothetical protein
MESRGEKNAREEVAQKSTLKRVLRKSEHLVSHKAGRKEGTSFVVQFSGPEYGLGGSPVTRRSREKRNVPEKSFPESASLRGQSTISTNLGGQSSRMATPKRLNSFLNLLASKKNRTRTSHFHPPRFLSLPSLFTRTRTPPRLSLMLEWLDFFFLVLVELYSFHASKTLKRSFLSLSLSRFFFRLRFDAIRGLGWRRIWGEWTRRWWTANAEPRASASCLSSS